MDVFFNKRIPMKNALLLSMLVACSFVSAMEQLFPIFKDHISKCQTRYDKFDKQLEDKLKGIDDEVIRIKKKIGTLKKNEVKQEINWWAVVCGTTKTVFHVTATAAASYGVYYAANKIDFTDKWIGLSMFGASVFGAFIVGDHLLLAGKAGAHTYENRLRNTQATIDNAAKITKNRVKINTLTGNKTKMEDRQRDLLKDLESMNLSSGIAELLKFNIASSKQN